MTGWVAPARTHAHRHPTHICTSTRPPQFPPILCGHRFKGEHQELAITNHRRNRCVMGRGHRFTRPTITAGTPPLLAPFQVWDFAFFFSFRVADLVFKGQTTFGRVVRMKKNTYLATCSNSNINFSPPPFMLDFFPYIYTPTYLHARLVHELHFCTFDHDHIKSIPCRLAFDHGVPSTRYLPWTQPSSHL
ncbi:MAG: hypothetical protein BYD32DRAFT_230030 [Podila humilis]|nr:MAG: hypothetical protein BYD32DRAFT_230030 [Podila humilis]